MQDALQGREGKIKLLLSVCMPSWPIKPSPNTVSILFALHSLVSVSAVSQLASTTKTFDFVRPGERGGLKLKIIEQRCMRVPDACEAFTCFGERLAARLVKHRVSRSRILPSRFCWC